MGTSTSTPTFDWFLLFCDFFCSMGDSFLGIHGVWLAPAGSKRSVQGIECCLSLDGFTCIARYPHFAVLGYDGFGFGAARSYERIG